MKIYKKLAFVVPRYAASIGGGAETLMRAIAIELVSRNYEVDIITTCALDHRTWDNHFEEKMTIEDGLNVYRFKVDNRDLEKFIRVEQKLSKGFSVSIEEQISWLKNSVNSSGVNQYLIDNEDKYDLFFFAPYLFGTTFWGSQLIPQKSILVPCLHDESYAYLPIIRTMFRRVRGIMWNALPEAMLAKEIYKLDDLEKKGMEVGMGFVDTSNILEKINFEHKSYFLYSGRKESGKGLDILLEYYDRVASEKLNLPLLVLIGSGKIDFRQELPVGVVDLGFVSENQKSALMHGAKALFQPSLNESFSIVLMESWLNSTPVVVNSDCAVTSYHVKKSKGGYHYRSYESFKEIILNISNNIEEVEAKGVSGKNYVNTVYSWDSVIDRFEKALSVW